MSDLPVSCGFGDISDRDALAVEIVLEIVDELQLFRDREPTDDRLQHRADIDVMFADKAAVVDVDKHPHQKLAVHPIRHAAMSWNAVTKVFDVESTLETGSKEATERSNQRSKASHEQQMELIRSIRDRVDLARENC